MAVVSDASPLSYLILIEEVEVLCVVYGEILIPPAVEKELRSPDGPGPPRTWVEEAPSWLQVKESFWRNGGGVGPEKIEKRLRALGRGESQAIKLAGGAGSELLIIDEWEGRRVAKEAGLRITGTLGVLDEAATEGLVDARDRAVSRDVVPGLFGALPVARRSPFLGVFPCQSGKSGVGAQALRDVIDIIYVGLVDDH